MKLKSNKIKLLILLLLIAFLTFLTADCKGQSLSQPTDSAIFITSHQGKTVVLMGATIDHLDTETKLKDSLISTLSTHIAVLNEKGLVQSKQIKRQKRKLIIVELVIWVQFGAVLLAINRFN